MVAVGRHRLLQLPRGADKQRVTVRVPIPRYQSLAANAAVAEPKRWDDLGADQADGRPLAPATANPSSVARESVRRQAPEVGAVCPNRARTELALSFSQFDRCCRKSLFESPGPDFKGRWRVYKKVSWGE